MKLLKRLASVILIAALILIGINVGFSGIETVEAKAVKVKMVLLIGENVQISQITGIKADKQLNKFKAKDTTVVLVNKGVIVALKEGKTIVSAKVKKKKVKIKVVVKERVTGTNQSETDSENSNDTTTGNTEVTETSKNDNAEVTTPSKDDNTSNTAKDEKEKKTGINARKDVDPTKITTSQTIEAMNPSLKKLDDECVSPIIYIQTDSGEDIKTDKQYVGATITVFNCDGQYEISEKAKIRTRGNSTTGNQNEANPYKVKFENKVNLLGLNKGSKHKSWVLLKEQWNAVPDYTAFSLGNEILGKSNFCSDCLLVNVYVNGKRQGLYQLCEQTDVGKSRVDVTEHKDEEYKGTDTGYLVEMDNYAYDEEWSFWVDKQYEIEDVAGVKKMTEVKGYSVKSDIYTEEQREFIKKYITAVYEIVYYACVENQAYEMNDKFEISKSKNLTPQEAVEKVFDTKEAADIMILHELCHSYDVGAGSFNMAVDFSKDSKLTKLTFTAPWDFNWAYGDNPSTYGFAACTFQKKQDEWDRSHPWYIMLYKADWFRELVKERWAKLNYGEDLLAITKSNREYMDFVRKDFRDKEWEADCGKDIQNFVEKRITWLNTQWK